MTNWLDLVACENGGHWFLGDATVCACGATTTQAATPPGPYGLLAGYKPSAQPEIPAHVKQAAKLCGASHLSADGKTGYRIRMGNLEYIRLDSSFPTWWETAEIELPAGAIKL
jgi:hypothetical protein